MQGPPLIWICRTNSLETGSGASTLPRHYHAHYELILARVRACVFWRQSTRSEFGWSTVGLEIEGGSTGARGQAMRASSATSPCLWERGGCCYCCYCYCMAVAFPQRMRRPSSCPPRNGSLGSAAVSVRSNARPLRVLLLPPYPTPAPSPCPRAALLAAAERRKGTTYGFITDGRQRWRHARARCSLACPLSDVRISIPPIISYPEVISHTRPALACLPIANHCCRGQVREGSPLLCVLCS